MSATVKPDQLRASAEVIFFAAAYILISTAIATGADLTFLFPASWSSSERATGSGFLAGAVVQVALVLVGAFMLRLSDLGEAVRASLTPSAREAWIIAGISTAIHVGTAMAVFIPEPTRIWEPSGLNLILSIVPAADGWSQEVVFRGYVLLRLARAGVAPAAQILLSGALFSAIHFGYAGEGAFEFLAPLIGTFMLGCFYAWAVQKGGGSLKPVIVCHVIIIVVLQPWLALAR